MQQPDKDKPAEKVPEKATSDSQLIRLEVGKKFGPWTIISKIDEGGFGSVYKVEDKQKKIAALKAESNDTEGGSAIKLEIAVLLSIHKDGERPYFPMIYHSAKRKKFCYMIVTLLGDNLRTLKMNQLSDKFTVSTWIRIAIQGLYSLKILHDEGFLHRDIKPANFCMGIHEKGRMLHLLDFGLARSYAKQTSNGIWQARRARASVEFRGTIRYCSPNVHRNLEQGRRDDIYSFMYLIVELNGSLPWKKERDKNKLKLGKLHIPDQILLKDFPEELNFVLPHLRALSVYSRPDYGTYYDAMVRVMQRLEVKFDDPYDWETPEKTKDLLSKQEKLPHEDEFIATDFFSSDPVRINGPPLTPKIKPKVPAKDKEKEKEKSKGRSQDGKTEENEIIKKSGLRSERTPDHTPNTQSVETPESKHQPV
jgi:serine/threonine protein kinase